MMRNIWVKISALLLTVIITATVLPACAKPTPADSYVAILPDVLHSGRTEALSLSLLSSGQFVRDNIEVTLLKDGREITSVRERINGNGTSSNSIILKRTGTIP